MKTKFLSVNMSPCISGRLPGRWDPMGLVREASERGELGAGVQEPEGMERCPRLEEWPR